MRKHHATLSEAKKTWEKIQGIPYEARHASIKYSGLKIFNRNKSRGRLKPLKNPYFVGSEFEWLNL